MNRLISLLSLLSLSLLGCTSDEQSPVADNSQTDSAWSKGAMVSAGNPYASEAGMEMLKAGGSAIDAAIATHLVLGLVEPQSSGLGGGAFILHFERTSGDMAFYDGRETAPAGATVDMFMGDDGVLGFLDSVQSGHAVGAPGVVRRYELAACKTRSFALGAIIRAGLSSSIRGFYRVATFG